MFTSTPNFRLLTVFTKSIIHSLTCPVDQLIFPTALDRNLGTSSVFLSLTLHTVSLSILTIQNQSHRCVFPELQARPQAPTSYPAQPLLPKTQSDHALPQLKRPCRILRLQNKSQVRRVTYKALLDLPTHQALPTSQASNTTFLGRISLMTLC